VLKRYKHFLLFVICVSILGQPSLYIGELYAQDEDSTLAICSFNIQFLGQSVKRDNIALVSILKDFDIVVVQELVAPPFDGTFPDGTPFKPDKEAARLSEFSLFKINILDKIKTDTIDERILYLKGKESENVD